MANAAPTPPDWMQACGLPQAWQGHPVWQVLDADFADGQRFLTLWQHWASDPHAPQMLHVVALAERAPDRDQIFQQLERMPGLAHHARVLAQQWFGFLPGFHRLVLHGQRLQLTLCIGTVADELRELRMRADTVLMPVPSRAADASSAEAVPEHDADTGSPCAEPRWDRWHIKALARLCRRGTRLIAPAATDSPAQEAAWAQAGFMRQGSIEHHSATAQCHAFEYRPSWQLRHTRSPWQRAPVPARHCIVVGAGLAGAAVANALARRGWQVIVLDAASAPASGASALPVGLLVPHVSRDDSARSQLARAGLRLTLQAAECHLHSGVDYCRCGVAELAIGHAHIMPDRWPIEGQTWSINALPSAATSALDRLHAPTTGAIWHSVGAWIKPPRLIQALLTHSSVRFQGNSPVQDIRRAATHWELIGTAGAVLARAPQVVFANAGGAARLSDCAARADTSIGRLTPLTALDGQISWALQTSADSAALSPFPVNGAGSAIGHIPTPDGPAWFVGATYENRGQIPISPLAPSLNRGLTPISMTPISQSGSDPNFSAHVDRANQHNRQQLARLLPLTAGTLDQAFESGRVHAWRGTRWASRDRLPVVGALGNGAQGGLWVSTAMGSRGLSYALLCAEVIAAQLCGEPAPLPERLLRLIDVR